MIKKLWQQITSMFTEKTTTTYDEVIKVAREVNKG